MDGMNHPLMTCPACARRLGGLVAPECVACDGLGVIPLGHPALNIATPTAVARAITLTLEDTARHATHQPQPTRPQAITAAIIDLRTAGLIHTGPTGHPARNTPPTHQATPEQLTIALDHNPTPGRLDDPHQPIATARTNRHEPAHLSASGHPSHLAQVTDPIPDLGPDISHYENEHAATEHAARGLMSATPTAAARRRAHR